MTQPTPFTSSDPRIHMFLNGSPFAVVGASTDRNKYGNKILRCYQQHQRLAYPINPRSAADGQSIEGVPAIADLASLPEPVHGISIITPPAVTEKIVEQAIALGIKNIWMQPGAVVGPDDPAVQRATAAGINVIPGDACLLVVLGYRDH